MRGLLRVLAYHLLVSRAAVTHKASLRSQRRRDGFIDYLKTHRGTIKSACEACDIPHSTYLKWRTTFSDFGPKVDEIRRSMREAPKKFDGSFTSFREHYLGMHTTWFQAHIIDAIEKARPGEIVLILIPPAHGKTTLLEDWCTYKLVTNPQYRITVASETVTHPEKILDRVRGRLEPEGPTPQISLDFGPIAPEKSTSKQIWGARRFNVAQKRSADERDFSMSAVGITGRVQGTRCDLLLLDDMQDVKSLELSDKYHSIITQSFLTRPEMFGRTVIIGTRVGEQDVYRKLMDAQIPDRVIRIPAYDPWKSPVWDIDPERKPKEDDESTWAPEGMVFLWPEKYDLVEEGSKRRQAGLHRFRYAKLRFTVGEQTWWRNYMQKPEAASTLTFDEATTTHMRDEHRSVIADVRPLDHREVDTLEPGQTRPCPVIIAVDPAVGGGNGVLSAAARPRRLEVLTAHLDYGLTKFSQIIDLIEEDCHRFSTPDSVVTTVVVEDKAFQKGLLQDDRMLELQTRFGFRIVPNTTGREKSDKDIGVPSMPMSMVRQEITIPWADEVSQKEMAKLLAQLHQWRPGVNGVKLPQDLVMCLWFAFRQWRAVRDTPVHAMPDLGRWRAAASPMHRHRPRTMTHRRPVRSLRGGMR